MTQTHKFKTPAVELINVSKDSNGQRIFDQLNLRIKAGQAFGLIAPSGFGKTLFCEMLTGLTIPTRGTIKIGGLNLNDSSLEAKEKISFVPAIPEFYKKLTVGDYFSFLRKVYKMTAASFDEEQKRLCKAFHLPELNGHLLESLSLESRKKIMVIGALVHKPETILFDEPKAHLSKTAARQLKALLKIHIRRGSTVISSFPSLNEARNWCDESVKFTSEGLSPVEKSDNGDF